MYARPTPDSRTGPAPPNSIQLTRRVIARGATRVEVTGFARPDVVPAVADADERITASRW